MSTPIPNTPDELIRACTRVPTDDKVSVLIPTDIYRHLVRVAKNLTSGVCSAPGVLEGEQVSAEGLLEIALHHYIENEVLWED